MHVQTCSCRFVLAHRVIQLQARMLVLALRIGARASQDTRAHTQACTCACTRTHICRDACAHTYMQRHIYGRTDARTCAEMHEHIAKMHGTLNTVDICTCLAHQELRQLMMVILLARWRNGGCSDVSQVDA